MEENFSMSYNCVCWGKGDGLGMIQVHYIYCVLSVIITVICKERLTQLTIMQNQWEA